MIQRAAPKSKALLISVGLAIAAGHLASCGGGGSTTGSGGSIVATSVATTVTTTHAGGPVGSGSTSNGTFMTGVGGSVADWTDAPGACPTGMPQVDISTAADLASASRGDAPFDTNAPATCYFIHTGTYDMAGVVMYVLKGGDPGGTRRMFVGQDRNNVIIRGRGNVEDGTSDVTISNMTFDLTGYQQAGAFNTLNLGNGKNITVDHVTFTGDCMTGSQGGHIETNNTSNVLVEECIIEKFGHCGVNGHLDHGIYLGAGSNITIRNNLIRGNSSRGIQLYTQGGQYGTLDNITIEQNRITHNGHADYEDGIVINSYGTGPITNVTIRRNIIDNNYYSGIRFAGGTESGITVINNTFDSNGLMSPMNGSEISIDMAGGGSGTMASKNIFKVANALINDCYDATMHGFGIGNDFVDGVVPDPPKGNCITNETIGIANFVSAMSGDYHPMAPEAQNYGAYAP
jgi:parallel beta-helix repeat protein